MSDLKPCIHLDYSSEFIGCELKEIEGFSCPVKYWERMAVPYEGAPTKVQFCKKRGRINEIFACYNGEKPCYCTELPELEQ